VQSLAPRGRDAGTWAPDVVDVGGGTFREQVLPMFAGVDCVTFSSGENHLLTHRRKTKSAIDVMLERAAR